MNIKTKRQNLEDEVLLASLTRTALVLVKEKSAGVCRLTVFFEAKIRDFILDFLLLR